MPTTYAETYFPLLIQILIALAVAGGMIGASAFVGRKVKDRIKNSPYESGMEPVGDARERYSVKFYLVAMVFILFDIEAIFLYPWASRLPGVEVIRLLRDAAVHRVGPVRLLLHLEERRARLVERRPRRNRTGA